MGGSRSPSPSLIPYYVLERLDGITRVLFLVPSELATRCTVHPILCRGSAFSLYLDENNTTNDNNNDTITHDNDDEDSSSFLAVDFTSPYPEDLAREIAIRLTRRLDDAQLDQEASRQQFLTLA